jgi:dCTP deaminase
LFLKKVSGDHWSAERRSREANSFRRSALITKNMSGFWSSETLLGRLPKLIKPFQADRVRHAAYELALGGEAFVTGEKARRVISDAGEVVIPQGQFAVLITEEEIEVPADAIAFISMKSENKFRGLINVSGFHVDPGWSGKLIFSVFNAGVQELHLSKGVPIFMIWFASLDLETADLYKGAHKGQQRIPDSIITNIAAKHPSPSALQQEINEVRRDVTHWRSITLLLLGIVLAGIINVLIGWLKPAAPTQVVVPYPVPTSTAAPIGTPLGAEPSATKPAKTP